MSGKRFASVLAVAALFCAAAMAQTTGGNAGSTTSNTSTTTQSTGAAAQSSQGSQSSAQGSKSAQTGQTGQGSQSDMIPVMPGIKQEITGGDREQLRIAREVRHELATLPYYSIFDDLRYKVEGSTVILGGSTISVGLKRDAESAVKGIEGVERVVNNIEELPPSPADDRIRRAVAQRIFSFDGLSRYAWEAAPSIRIIVRNGRVRLEGVVDREADKSAAGIQANQTPGIFGVENNLKVVQRASK